MPDPTPTKRDPSKRQIGAYIPKHIKDALVIEAEKNNRNLSNQLVVIIRQWLADQKNLPDK